MLPFVMFSIPELSFKPPVEYDIYFFFPFYHTGGAEQVHLQIAKLFGKTHKCIIFFTRLSGDERHLKEFEDTGCTIKDISNDTDNKLFYIKNIMWRGKVSSMINSQIKRPVVFNGQCNFGYKISPWIRKDITQIELIHSFNTFSWIRLPFLPFITKTVMISKQRIDEHIQQYKKLEVPDEFIQRIHFIQNAIELPQETCRKKINSITKMLFVGRGTPEKRPELFISIARAAQRLGVNATFTLVGEMDKSILSDLPQNLSAIGNVNEPSKLHQIYCEHHILIIPSTTEGFPIVLMEGMARGCAVMATPVGDIPYHINETNGFLYSSTDESTVVIESIEWLKQLTQEKLQQLSATATSYAFKNFSIETFNQQYKTILQP
jgi:glycosyltransferase involved in cell wall biosynthesis